MRNGWETRPLGDVATLQRGFDLPTRRRVNGDYPLVSSSGVIDSHNESAVRGPGVVTGRSGSIGNIFFVEEDYWPLNTVLYVKDFHGNEPRFVFHLLNYFDLKRFATGTGVPTLNRNFVHDELVDVPASTAEQRRIVGILDEAFEGIATAKASAETNLQNARAVFESHLQSVFTKPGKGWIDTTIGEAIRFIDYRGKTPVKTASGIRLITAKNVKMGYVQETPMEFIASENYCSWMTRGIPQKGDVLFTTEAPLANVAQLETDEKVAFAQRIIIMQPEKTKLVSTFLKYMLLSAPVQQRIRAEGTGATVQGIKASLLKLVEISFPNTVAEQMRIVETLDAVSEETRRLESVYNRKLAALEALKKSLLHQAFAGEL
jgi:type I restriction enzyme S subunit